MRDDAGMRLADRLYSRLPAPLARWADAAAASVSGYGAHRGSLASGGLAYFVVLAIAPCAVALGGLAGLLLDPQQVRDVGEAIAERLQFLSGDASGLANGLVELASQASAGAVTVTTITAFVLAVYAASKVLYGLRLALDQAFGAAQSDRPLVARLGAAVMALIAMIAAVGLLVVLTVIPRILRAVGLGDVRVSTGSGPVDWLLMLLLIWLVVWLVMSRVPDHRVRVGPLAPGVLLAAVWILAVSGGVGLYVSLSSSLGVAIAVFGAPIVLLLWLYLCFTGLLLAAEWQAALASGAEPAGRSDDQGQQARGERAADPG
jgi:membrane protein